MSSIWAVGIPILLVDVANPVLLVAIAYALTRSRPIAKSYALILGHTLAYFTDGHFNRLRILFPQVHRCSI